MTDDPRVEALVTALGWTASTDHGRLALRRSAARALAAVDAVDPLRKPRDPASATAAHAVRTGPRNWTMFEPARVVFGSPQRKRVWPDA